MANSQYSTVSRLVPWNSLFNSICVSFPLWTTVNLQTTHFHEDSWRGDVIRRRDREEESGTSLRPAPQLPHCRDGAQLREVQKPGQGSWTSPKQRSVEVLALLFSLQIPITICECKLAWGYVTTAVAADHFPACSHLVFTTPACRFFPF